MGSEYQERSEQISCARWSEYKRFAGKNEESLLCAREVAALESEMASVGEMRGSVEEGRHALGCRRITVPFHLNFSLQTQSAIVESRTPTMSSLLAKRIVSSYLFSSSPLKNHHLALLTPLLRQFLSTQTQQQKETPFIAQYLISSLGISPDRALKISSEKKLAEIKSSSGPDLVVQFLREIGLSNDMIKSAISFDPRLLSLNVEETLKPNLHQLLAAGFTGEILVKLIRHSPSVLAKPPIASLQFWRDFMGDNDAFLKLIKKNGLLVTRDIDKNITPRLNLLKEYGFSDNGIMKLLTKSGSRFMLLQNLDNFSRKLKQNEELGFSRGSNMFIHGLKVVGNYKKETIEKKLQYFQKMYGWSEEEVWVAFNKFPNILATSEKRVKATMDFLIKNVGLEPRSIAMRPIFFSYSLEKRLVPRQHVLSILKEHGLNEDPKLFTACVMSEKTFLERFIVPYEKDVPGLAEAYAAACSGKVPH
ncbi:mTERF [Carex littledalei]|uniref:mTERF n=1 Tax=Carex littledalei TaxID=544730 RepID=A0A833V752_9POAL|nr:mTERF [Carex littledalei]